MPLSSQTILVTGATGAIGKAICRSLAADGARVLIHFARNRTAAEALLAEIGGNGAIFQADLTDPAAPSALWDQAQALGRIHGLVNNAGIRSEVELDAPLPDWHATWDREFRVNLFAAADLSRAAILHFQRHGGGRIVMMGSRSGQRGYMSNAMAYAAAKAALMNLTKTIAKSHGHEGITAVNISPGWVRTDMAEAYIAQHGEAAVTAEVPVGRIVAPSEVGEMVAFALRPSQVSLTGATIDLNGASYLR